MFNRTPVQKERYINVFWRNIYKYLFFLNTNTDKLENVINAPYSKVFKMWTVEGQQKLGLNRTKAISELKGNSWTLWVTKKESFKIDFNCSKRRCLNDTGYFVFTLLLSIWFNTTHNHQVLLFPLSKQDISKTYLFGNYRRLHVLCWNEIVFKDKLQYL